MYGKSSILVTSCLALQIICRSTMVVGLSTVVLLLAVPVYGHIQLCSMIATQFGGQIRIAVAQFRFVTFIFAVKCIAVSVLFAQQWLSVMKPSSLQSVKQTLTRTSHTHCTHCVTIPLPSTRGPRLTRFLMALVLLTVFLIGARFNLHVRAMPLVLVLGKFALVCALEAFAALVLLQTLFGLCLTAAVNARLLALAVRFLGFADTPVYVAILLSALLIENSTLALQAIALDSRHCDKLAVVPTVIPTILLAIGCEAIVAHGNLAMIHVAAVVWHVFSWVSRCTCALRQHTGCLRFRVRVVKCSSRFWSIILIRQLSWLSW